MFKLFHRALNGDPLTNARESVKEAMRELSRREAEANYHRRLRDFHETEAAEIDPNTDWWTFAQHKQEAQDHCIEQDVELMRVRKAQAKVDAAKERLRKLQE